MMRVMIKENTRLSYKALAFSLLIAIMLTACASVPLPDGAGECHPSMDYPHQSSTVPGFIDGKTKIKCVYKGTMRDLYIETKLQKKVDGKWTDVPKSTGKKQKANPKSGVTYTGVSAFVKCQKGEFRTAGRGSGYLNGKYSGSTAWGYSKGVVNPCDKR